MKPTMEHMDNMIRQFADKLNANRVIFDSEIVGDVDGGDKGVRFYVYHNTTNRHAATSDVRVVVYFDGFIRFSFRDNRTNTLNSITTSYAFEDAKTPYSYGLDVWSSLDGSGCAPIIAFTLRENDYDIVLASVQIKPKTNTNDLETKKEVE